MLNKVNYVSNETVIGAQNLNDIQDEIINNQQGLDKCLKNTPGQVGALNLASDAVKLHFKNIEVATSAFAADTTYADYPFRAMVALEGALASMIPEVILDAEDVDNGIIAPISVSYDGGIYLYASEIPEITFTIPTILLWRTDPGGSSNPSNGIVTIEVSPSSVVTAIENMTEAQANTAREGLGALPNVSDIITSEKIANGAVTLEKLDLYSIYVPADNAGAHNAIYRGKNLGTSVTAAQYSEISAGTFNDMFIGDYWVINNVTWRIAGFDYWLNHGDTACSTHHVVVVPDTNLAKSAMNSVNITTGAYVGSDYYTGKNGNTGKSAANTAIMNAFGSAHILTYREYLKNAVSNGYESAGAWYDSTFELMTEQMVYGCKVFGNVTNGTNIPASYTIGTSQLPLFAHNHLHICNRGNWWLRDVASAAHFVFVNHYGNANYDSASNAFSIRPAFGIKA